MLAHFSIQDLEQKELFFKISNCLSLLDSELFKSGKMAGLYLIIKDNYPVYAGQSKNIASRIATHLRGKYKECDYVMIFPMVTNGFHDFYERTEQSKNDILLANEKLLMSTFKPTENIMIDMDFKLEESQSMEWKLLIKSAPDSVKTIEELMIFLIDNSVVIAIEVHKIGDRTLSIYDWDLCENSLPINNKIDDAIEYTRFIVEGGSEKWAYI